MGIKGGIRQGKRFLRQIELFLSPFHLFFPFVPRQKKSFHPITFLSHIFNAYASFAPYKSTEQKYPQGIPL